MESKPAPKIKPEVRHRSPLGLLSFITGGRTLRSTLNREKLSESLKAMIWVIPLTLLIWIYGEREQMVYPNVPNANGIEVNISSSNSNRFVEPVGNPQPSVNLKLTGPQEAIERVKSQLTSTVPRGVSIDTGDMQPAQNQPINIVDRLQNLPVFKNNGVTVIESQPADVLVNIDNKQHVEVPVEIDPGDAANLSARFDPPKITLYGPSQVLRNQKLHVYADLSLVTLKNTGEQPPQSITVRLAPLDDRISMDRSKVTATLVVKASDITADVDQIPIVVEAPFATLRDYDISIVHSDDHSTPPVTVTGPPDLVNSIKNHKLIPKAVLVISPDDAVRQEPKILRYDLPPGVHVSKSDADRTVEFKMTARQASATPG